MNELDQNSDASTIGLAIREATVRLSLAGVPEARREAGSLLAHLLGKDRTFIISHAEDRLDEKTLEAFAEFIDRRALGEPQQYIIGSQTFYGLEFIVNRDVLIPRPETELLVEAALKLMDQSRVERICDVGTGSGCIAITLVHLRPSTTAVAIDISDKTIVVAQENAKRHGVTERISFAVGDTFTPIETTDRFDLIVSNPPYVAESALPGLQREVRDHEPLIALTPGGNGLSIIRKLIYESPSHLNAGGYLLFEIGFDQHEAVHQMLDPTVWRLLDIHPDLQGIPRTVALQLL
jgi:release factor glutamine methyltransferase